MWKLNLVLGEEDADGFRGFHGGDGFADFSGFGVEGEDGDGIAVLVAADQPFPGGVDLEMARGFASAGGVLEESEFSCFLIALVNYDGVVAAV